MKRERGRPKKPEGEKFITRALRFPPELWEELEAVVPRGERSAFIHDEVRRGLARLRKKREG